MYRLYNEDEGLSNIHNREQSPRTCIFDDPEPELYNRLVPECGGVSVSYWFTELSNVIDLPKWRSQERRCTVCRFKMRNDHLR